MVSLAGIDAGELHHVAVGQGTLEFVSGSNTAREDDANERYRASVRESGRTSENVKDR